MDNKSGFSSYKWSVRERLNEYKIQTTKPDPFTCRVCHQPCGCIFHVWEPRSETILEIVDEADKTVFNHGARLTADEAALIASAPELLERLRDRPIRDDRAAGVVAYVERGGHLASPWEIRREAWQSFSGAGSCSIAVLCQNCDLPCGVYRFGGEATPPDCKGQTRYDWLVGDERHILAQGIPSKRMARLIHAAPVMARLLAA